MNAEKYYDFLKWSFSENKSENVSVKMENHSVLWQQGVVVHVYTNELLPELPDFEYELLGYNKAGVPHYIYKNVPLAMVPANFRFVDMTA